MYKFDFDGNIGRCYPKPGEYTRVECGICGTQMDVERNVNGPTGFAEVMYGGKHLHDRFFCPFYSESWHKEIEALKYKAIFESINYWETGQGAPDSIREGLERIAKEILEEAEKQ